MPKYLKIIHDEDQIKWWYDYAMPPLLSNEIYFASLSLRKKKLTEEERKLVPHLEMFNKIQIRHDTWESFIKGIRSLEQRIDAWFKSETEDFINKAIVCYINLTPIDCYKACKDQLAYLTEVMTSLTDAALKQYKPGLEDCFYKVRKSFDTCQSLFARNFGQKIWIDFDLDFPSIDRNFDEEIENIRNYFNKEFGIGNTLLIRTAGGLHCLVRRTVFKMNPQIIIGNLYLIFPETKEIVRNKNEMCSLPGTYMGDHITMVLNKNDFKEEHKLHKM